MVSRHAAGQQLILWACLAAFIAILAVTTVFFSMHYQRASSSMAVVHEEHELLGARSKRGLAKAKPAGKTPMTSDNSDTERLSSSSMSPAGGATTPLPGLPLCPLLIVPDGTRLACTVQGDVCRRRQDLAFDLGAVPERGGAPLFRVRVTELGTDISGIYIETLSGREQLAMLSTENLWRGDLRPLLDISRPWGMHYATIQKGVNGEYAVMAGASTLLVFAGDFVNHSIRVMNSRDNIVATTMSTSRDEYQVHMQARTDAGLVVLGLLAIDKCEITAECARKRGDSGLSSEAASRSS